MKDKKETPDRFPTWWLLLLCIKEGLLLFRNTFLFILRTDIYTDVILVLVIMVTTLKIMLSLLVVGSYYLRQVYGCIHVQKQGEKR